MSMAMEDIVKAANNQTNSHILQLTTKKIRNIKLNVLKELQLSKPEIIDYMHKLKNYRYVDQMNEIIHGRFIRWIDISDPTNIKLSGVAIFCDFRITDRGVSVVYTNFFKNKRYEFLMEEAIIFQKLTYQEEVLLNVLNKIE